jgi:hypothetical protein
MKNILTDARLGCYKDFQANRDGGSNQALPVSDQKEAGLTRETENP